MTKNDVTVNGRIRGRSSRGVRLSPYFVLFLVLGCSSPKQPQRPVAGSTVEDPPPPVSVVVEAATVGVARKEGEEGGWIKMSLFNDTSEELVMCKPSELRTVDVTAASELDNFITQGSLKYPPDTWRIIKPGEARIGYIKLEWLVEAKGKEDGWYRCVLVYDDANSHIIARMIGAELSQVGVVKSSPIEILVSDEKPISWRAASSEE